MLSTKWYNEGTKNSVKAKNGPHFTAHAGRIEFHAPCRARKLDRLKVAALILLLAVAAFAMYLWLSA